MGKSRIGFAVIAAVAAATLTCVVAGAIFWAKGGGGASGGEANMPREYVYETATAENGMELHVLRALPSNVTLEPVRNNVAAAPFYGINGGFFYEKALLSMAVVNDVPVNGPAGHYGSGSVNAKYARGTLVWDGALNKLSVQVARQAAELEVTDRAHYWAQGGISMSLGRDASWAEQAAKENAPFPDDDRLRSAAVFDEDGDLFLVVSATKGTLAEFREAIVERVGEGRLANGIFLDGDGSSQLRSREATLSGDGRPVVQMMRLIR